MSTIRCPQCNLTNFATAIVCKRCGYFFQPPAESAAAINPAPAEQAAFAGGEQQAFNEFQSAVQPAAATAVYTPQPQFPPPPPPPRQNYYQQQQQYQAYQPSKQKSGLAIASLVLGLVGCFITSPIGLILGIVAMVKANRRPHEYGGKGLAIAGVILNALGLLFLPVIVAIAIPNLLMARRAANEGSAILTLRQLSEAEHKYMASMYGKCGDIQTLIAGKLINDLSLAKNEKNGYRFMVVNLPMGGCELHATPLTTSHGTRSFFYSTEDRVFRAADKKGQAADKQDLPLTSNLPDDVEDSLWGQPPSESAAISSLRSLHGAEMTYAATLGNGACGTLQDLANAQLIKKDLADGTADGYRFAVKKISQFGCEITATPISNSSSARSFFVGNEGVIRGKAKNGALADKNDPPIF